MYEKDAPLVLEGTGGSFTIEPAEVDGPAWINYTPTFNGSLTLTITSAVGWLSTFTVYNDEDEPWYDESDGTLAVVGGTGERIQISLGIRESLSGGQVTVDVDWSYAARASSRLDVVLDRYEIVETPGALAAGISNGRTLDDISFSLIGPTTIDDFQTATLNEAGSLDLVAVNLPALIAGDYLLRVEGVVSGSEDVEFTVLEDGLQPGNEPKPPPTPPVTVATTRWRFIDMRDPSLNYTMERNPRSWTNVHPPTEFTHENTTAPDGQMLTWQAGERPWRMEFSGYIDSELQYAHLAFWASLRRRFWLIDHRNRAWLVTFEHFDAQARIVPNRPWAHDYTMKTLIFMQGEY